MQFFDIAPDVYPTLPVTAFDLCVDLPELPPDETDIVIHSHVLEHIPTDPIATTNELTTKLVPGGLHIFCVPIVSGWYREDLSPNLSAEEREARFGQGDHLRMFGRNDFKRRFLEHIHHARLFQPIDVAPHETLNRLRVPDVTWRTLTGNSLIVVERPSRT